jgi:hypothetical protein
MLGSCNYYLDNNRRCGRTWQLYNLLFFNPFAPSYVESIHLCKIHHDQLASELQERTLEFKIRLSNLIAQKAREQKLAKDNDNYYNPIFIQRKIDDLLALKKQIQTNECRNYLCMRNFDKLGENEKLYSVNTFSPKGRRQYTFYFCSLKCYNFIKGKCGLPVAIKQAQHTLF